MDRAPTPCEPCPPPPTASAQLDLGTISIGWLVLCVPIALATLCLLPSKRKMMDIRDAAGGGAAR